jgi:type IV pilus assembly protein PilE
MLKIKGFTLMELMIVVVIIGLIVIIALPAYQAEIRRSDAAVAQQEILKLAEQLERYKSRNFSYHGFDPKYLYDQLTPMNKVQIPLKGKKKYTINLYDTSEPTAKILLSSAGGLGQKWAIIAISDDVKNYSFLMNSSGVRCKNKTKANITFVGCGNMSTGMESW